MRKTGFKQGYRPPMTDRIAFWLGLLIVSAVIIDVALYGTEHLLFLGKKFSEFLEWIAFWR